MIPSGTLDHDHERISRARTSAHHSARTADVDSSQRAAEAAIERLLASWHGDGTGGLESAYLWEGDAMDTIDALSALLGEVDLAGSGPVMISPRSGS